MDLSESLNNLAEKIEANRDTLYTEEATKNALIAPFISALGYDFFNPKEVIPEYSCDDHKSADKVDYALAINDKVVILIECKQCNVCLEQYNKQLSKYFTPSKASFSILTNGIEYKFYHDLMRTNVMDDVPFITIDMSHLKESDITFLDMFRKENFNEGAIHSFAKTIRAAESIVDILTHELRNPSDDFIKIIARQYYSEKVNKKTIQELRPVITSCLEQILTKNNSSPQQPKAANIDIVNTHPAVQPTNDTGTVKGKKSPRFTFSMVNLPVGTPLTFVPTGITVTVADDNHIEYNGQLYKLSPFVKIFMPAERQNTSGAYQGARYFSYKGELLDDIRTRMENKAH